MKKTILLIAVCTLVFSARAQFKVQSDGKIAIQTTSTALSPISINCTGNTDYYLTCETPFGNSGMSVYAKGLLNNSTTYVSSGYFRGAYGQNVTGVTARAEYGNNCIGVLGSADAGIPSIGVYGRANYTSKGAGIYGSTNSYTSIALAQGELYAGFFEGNVKTTGNITVGTTILGTLLGESSNNNTSSNNTMSLRTTSVTDGFSSLVATAYQKERVKLPENRFVFDDSQEEIKDKGDEREPDKMDEQFYEKTHYALDADRLEEVFPDLVYVRDDGSKVINYMEMIPLLVQSINELNAEVKELKSQASGGKARSMRSATSIETTSLAGNVLYQNSPNPFKETTTIRFSLAPDAKDAAICIFDMQGKMLQKRSVSVNETSLNLNGYELGAGMYLYTLIVNGQEVDTKRMIITQ